MNISSQKPFVLAAKELLGEHGCYPLMAVEVLKVKNAWQMYASNHNIAPKVANEISKHIDEYLRELSNAEDDMKDSIIIDDYIPEEYVEIFEDSKTYQGIVTNLKVHTCGFLLLNGDIRREIGLVSAVSKTTNKRTICAAIEGKYLDDFGYVKEDFLIVDAVSLTDEFFQALGRTVPTFEELKEMVKNDDKTWEIYEKGITCCINQCENEPTANKGKRYKPRNIRELAMFIAGIRPGFKTLLNTFLNRETYTTGEDKIDEILKDSDHFLIYQESIMKVLSFLGLEMGETYTVIKNISKKKYQKEPEKLSELKERLKEGWVNQIGNLDNFDNVWNVIESSSRYAFNSPHAYSMAGDSLYQAWGKANHTEVFYEVAIKHYQKKGNKDKIDALVKEMIKFYGYRLGSYEFGKDNRSVTIDKENKTIYPNISSIKGFGESVAEELYKWGQNEYNTFLDVIKDKPKEINKKVFANLIKIGYFSKYGDVNTLLETAAIYDMFSETKEVSKEKLAKNDISESIVAKYGNETAKKYTKLDTSGLIDELISNIEYRKQTIKEKLDDQNDILGILTVTDTSYNKRTFYVSKLVIGKSITNIDLYEIYSGKTRNLKMWTNSFVRNEFKEKDLLYVTKIDKKNKQEFTGEINPETGKRIYKPVPDKFETWLVNYQII